MVNYLSNAMNGKMGMIVKGIVILGLVAGCDHQGRGPFDDDYLVPSPVADPVYKYDIPPGTETDSPDNRAE